MSDPNKIETLCDRVNSSLIDIVQGEAPESLYDHIAECDRCRDARHDAERARDLALASGADYQTPEDMAARVQHAVEALGTGKTAMPRSDEAGEGTGAVGRTQPMAEPARSIETSDGASARAAQTDNAIPQPSSPTEKAASFHWLRRPRNTVATGLLGAALAAAAVAVVVGDLSGDATDEITASMAWQGRVTKVSRAAGGSGGLSICDAKGAKCSAASAAALVPRGSVLRTDDRTRAYFELGDGTRVALDRSTELRLDAETDRSAELTQGALVAEVAKVEGKLARIALPRGHVEVLGTKFALRQSGEVASVDVSRGSVRLVDEQSREVVVRAGEEGRSYAGAAPYAISAPALGEALSWSESHEEESVSVRGLGELKAKKPGSDDERDGAVTLSSHKVKVRIVDGFARTEIDEVFTNSTDEVLEGIYRFPLPPDAQIERLALEVDGELEEGAFLDRERAAKIWRGAIVNATRRRPRPRDEIIWVPGPWKDPALLEWQRGGRFELRIFPIPKKGSRRVVLTYTQVLQPTGNTRRYVYPLAHDESGSTRVGHFDVDVQLRGHDPATGVAVHGYALRHGGDQASHSLTMNRQQFVPTGDLVIEYGLPAGTGELSAWAYAPSASDGDDASNKKKPATQVGDAPILSDRQPYLAMTLQPKLPRLADDAQRAYAIVVDASRSMFGERYRRASSLAARLVRELDRFDRFTVLACDTGCRRMVGGLLAPGPQEAARVKAFLAGVTPEGASDPTAALREATAVVTEGRALRVVYIGDGTPTAGAIRPRYVTAAVGQATAGGRATVTAVAIGADADLDALGAMARGGGGVVLPYVPGQRIAESAFAILGATYGMGLRDVEIELPAGLAEVAPNKLDTIPAGGQALVVARMDAPRVQGTVLLRGKVGDAPFEQRYPIDVRAVSGQANAFVPRLYAAARIADLERDGSAAARKQAVALSSRFNVASRYTSLLVLESAAMFRAFGLDNSRRAPVWTGQALADASRSQGEKEVADGKADKGGPGSAWGESFSDDPVAGGLGASGTGAGGSGRSKKSSAPSMAPRPVGTMPPPPPPPMASPGDPLARPARPPRRRRPMIPMRRIWERKASIDTARLIPVAAATEKIAAAEADLGKNENRRAAMQKLYNLYALAGRLDDAERLATRWSEKDALDPQALTARADVAARRGEREMAIRILGSVIDVRPGAVAAHQRLARLHRWAGRSALACRHSFAVAQLREDDQKAVSQAVSCLRTTGEAPLAEDLLRAVANKVRKQVEVLLKQTSKPDKVRGEVRLTATWQGGAHDLDVALVHQSGHRISWLGAPSRAIISAENVHSSSTEQLGLLGSAAGEYTVEITRASGEGPVSGELRLRAPGMVRTIPFTLQGDQLTLGTMRVAWQSRLVRAWDVRRR